MPCGWSKAPRNKRKRWREVIKRAKESAKRGPTKHE